MRRAVLDSNAVDPIAELPGAYEVVRTAIDEGRLDVLFTHVTVDEVNAISDADRRGRLLRVLSGLGRHVPTGAFIVGVTPLGFGRLTDDVQTVEALRSGNAGHSHDALIGATASMEQCALVTADRRLAARARDRGIEVLTPLDLLAEVGFSIDPA